MSIVDGIENFKKIIFGGDGYCLLEPYMGST